MYQFVMEMELVSNCKDCYKKLIVFLENTVRLAFDSKRGTNNLEFSFKQCILGILQKSKFQYASKSLEMALRISTLRQYKK